MDAGGPPVQVVDGVAACSSKLSWPQPRVNGRVRLRASRDAQLVRTAHLRSRRRRSHRSGLRHGHRVLLIHGRGGKKDPGTPFPSRRTCPRPAGEANPAQPAGQAHGPALRHPPPAQPRPNRDRAATATAPTPTSAHLRHHHAGRRRRPPRRPNRRPPRRPMHHQRSDRARKNLDRHLNYILAAHMASVT